MYVFSVDSEKETHHKFLKLWMGKRFISMQMITVVKIKLPCFIESF